MCFRVPVVLMASFCSVLAILFTGSMQKIAAGVPELRISSLGAMGWGQNRLSHLSADSHAVGQSGSWIGRPIGFVCVGPSQLFRPIGFVCVGPWIVLACRAGARSKSPQSPNFQIETSSSIHVSEIKWEQSMTHDTFRKRATVHDS